MHSQLAQQALIGEQPRTWSISVTPMPRSDHVIPAWIFHGECIGLEIFIMNEYKHSPRRINVTCSLLFVNPSYEFLDIQL